MMNEDALKSKLQSATLVTGMTFNEVFHRLVMERFLVRVSLSNHANNFVFKGGFLLSHYVDLGRDTRDLDFLITKLAGEKDILEPVLVEISKIETGDAFFFSLKNIQSLLHDHMNYPGFTANFSVSFGRMRENLEIDIGVGDEVTPATASLKLMQGKGKSIFEDEVSLLVYPAETILAEKLQTAVLRAGQNSRMKDFYDMLSILHSALIDPKPFKNAIEKTFVHRGTAVDKLPLRFSETEFETLQKFWTPFYRGLRKKENIPQNIGEVVAAINEKLVIVGF